MRDVLHRPSAARRGRCDRGDPVRDPGRAPSNLGAPDRPVRQDLAAAGVSPPCDPPSGGNPDTNLDERGMQIVSIKDNLSGSRTSRQCEGRVPALPRSHSQPRWLRPGPGCLRLQPRRPHPAPRCGHPVGHVHEDRCRSAVVHEDARVLGRASRRSPRGGRCHHRPPTRGYISGGPPEDQRRRGLSVGEGLDLRFAGVDTRRTARSLGACLHECAESPGLSDTMSR